MISAALDATVIVAPAGYGKTRLAARLAAETAASGWCDCSKPSLQALASGVLAGLAAERSSRALPLAHERAVTSGQADREWSDAVRGAWTVAASEPSTFVFDNVEEIAGDDACVELIAELVASCPPQRRIVLCSRLPLPRRIVRRLRPDRTTQIGGDDLRLNDAACRALIGGNGDVDGELVERAIAIAGGWPMAAVMLARFAAAGHLAEALAIESGAAYDALFNYLIAEYIRLLEPREFDALRIAAMLPAPTARETAELAGLDARAFAEFLTRSAFVRAEATGPLTVQPLIVALVAARYGVDRGALLARAAARARERRDWLRAAEIALHAGDAPAAARDLATDGVDLTFDELPRVVGLLSRLDRDQILEEPRLWVSTLEIRRFQMPLAQLVAEGRQVSASIFRRDVTPALAFDVTRQCVSIMMHAGKLADAIAIVDEAERRIADPEVHRRLRLMRMAIASTQGAYVRAREHFAREAGGQAHENVKFLDLIDATTALRSGKYDEGVAMLEEAIRMQRQRCWIAQLLSSLSNLAYEAWLVRDEERFARAVAELKANVSPGLERAWRFWLAAANGEEAEPTGYEPMSIVAIGYLFLACASSGHRRIVFARRAVQHCDASSDIGLRIMAHLVLAEYDPERRREAQRDLRMLAAAVDLAPFRDAVLAYADGAKSVGALEAFVVRRVRRDAAAGESVALRITTGMLLVAGVPVTTSALELALLIFMATYGRAASRNVLCDALWPDAEADAAANNLKVLVHRIRKKAGAGTIVLVNNGYCLGSRVTVDLFACERAVRDAQAQPVLAPAEIEQLVRIAESIGDRSPDDLLRYDWYVGIDRRLRSLRRRTFLVSAQRLIALGDVARARELCAHLLRDDDHDEECSALLRRCQEWLEPAAHPAAAVIAV